MYSAGIHPGFFIANLFTFVPISPIIRYLQLLRCKIKP